MDLFQELGLKVHTVNEDEISEALWLRSLDRWGDLTVCGRDVAVCEAETRYYFEPKVRRRLRYQAAILRS